jgi:hypothetical protein
MAWPNSYEDSRRQETNSSDERLLLFSAFQGLAWCRTPGALRLPTALDAIPSTLASQRLACVAVGMRTRTLFAYIESRGIIVCVGLCCLRWSVLGLHTRRRLPRLPAPLRMGWLIETLLAGTSGNRFICACVPCTSSDVSCRCFCQRLRRSLKVAQPLSRP